MFYGTVLCSWRVVWLFFLPSWPSSLIKHEMSNWYWNTSGCLFLHCIPFAFCHPGPPACGTKMSWQPCVTAAGQKWTEAKPQPSVRGQKAASSLLCRWLAALLDPCLFLWGFPLSSWWYNPHLAASLSSPWLSLRFQLTNWSDPGDLICALQILVITEFSFNLSESLLCSRIY